MRAEERLYNALADTHPRVRFLGDPELSEY